MRPLLLAGMSPLASSASVATAMAAPIFSFSAPGFYSPTLAPGAYEIVATGAGGGNGFSFAQGGLGAVVEGTFTFTAPQTLRVLVGGQGGSFEAAPGSFGNGPGGGGRRGAWIGQLGALCCGGRPGST